MLQNTIKNPFSFSGTGLHTGRKVNITLKPAPPGTGIVFNYNNKKVRLGLNNITNTTRSISIGRGGDPVRTVEHLTAALYMSNITDLYIDMDNNELPAMDGSGLPFLKLISRCGISGGKKQHNKISLKKPVKLIQKERFIIGLPSEKLKITYAVDFNHPDLKNSSIHFENITREIFKKQIAPARTFGFQKEVDSLFKKGLALGGSLENAVVLTDDGYLNKKLRFKDECIRHKVLDFIGILAFLIQPINGHFIIYKSGHEFDLQFIKKLNKLIRAS